MNLVNTQQKYIINYLSGILMVIMITPQFFVPLQTWAQTENRSWSDPATWPDGVVPGDGAKVTISGNVEIPFGYSTTRIRELTVPEGAKLTIDSSAELNVHTILVMGEFNLKDAKIMFLKDPLDPTDYTQLGRGLIAMGNAKVNLFGTSRGLSHVSLVGAAKAGATVIETTELTDWFAGDKISLPDTRPFAAGQFSGDLGLSISNTGVRFQTQREQAIIDHVDGNLVYLMAPLRYDHVSYGGQCTNQITPEVALLTRSSLITSEDASSPETRGHTMSMDHTVTNIDGVAFVGLGRTTTAQPTQFDPAHPLDPSQKQNQVGRYPVHFHRAVAQTSRLANSVVWNEPTLIHIVRQMNLNQVEEFIQRNSVKVGVSLHGSQNATVENNIFIGAGGSGIFIEDDSDMVTYHNRISGNYVSDVRGHYKTSINTGGGFAGLRFTITPEGTVIWRNNAASTGFGIWAVSPFNDIHNNVVYSVGGNAVEQNAFHSKTGFVPALGKTVRMQSSLLNIHDNVAVGMRHAGVELWGTAVRPGVTVGDPLGDFNLGKLHVAASGIGFDSHYFGSGRSELHDLQVTASAIGVKGQKDPKGASSDRVRVINVVFEDVARQVVGIDTLINLRTCN